MTKSVLDDAFNHHAWANLRLIDTCLGLTPEQLDTTVAGTYGSIIDTIRHTIGGDAAYLFVLTGGRTPQIDEERMDLAALRATAAENQLTWSELLAGELDPDEDVIRHRDDGSESHATLGVRLAQALHHGTDHRSQVCTALTSLGIEPPEIDVWAFAQEAGRAHVTEAATSQTEA